MGAQGFAKYLRAVGVFLFDKVIHGRHQRVWEPNGDEGFVGSKGAALLLLLVFHRWRMWVLY